MRYYEIINESEQDIKDFIMTNLIPFRSQDINEIPLDKFLEKIMNEFSLDQNSDEDLKLVLDTFDDIKNSSTEYDLSYDINKNILKIVKKQDITPDEETVDNEKEVDKMATKGAVKNVEK